MFTAANLILFGFGMNSDRVKFYVANEWSARFDELRPVLRIMGSMMGIAERQQHMSFPFIAVRSRVAFTEIKTVVYPASDARIPPRVREFLNRSEGAY